MRIVTVVCILAYICFLAVLFQQPEQKREALKPIRKIDNVTSKIYSAVDLEVIPPKWLHKEPPGQLQTENEKHSGYVILQCVVGTKGNIDIEDIKLLRTVIPKWPEFDQLQIEALAKSTFEPATLKGVPVRYEMTLLVHIN